VPRRPASPCSSPGCPAFQPCPQHARVPWNRNANRSAGARGYGPAWRKARTEVLAEEPFCRLCLQQGRVTPTTDVDHIVPKARGGTDARSNLRGREAVGFFVDYGQRAPLAHQRTRGREKHEGGVPGGGR
jgi:5-methylcytosine-specific restriction enzyme A